MYNSDHHPVCNFSGEIVSYLYDEIKPREKEVFETHLAKCGSCVEELAAFSELRTALGDWRENVFAPLQTPEILIPYDLLPVASGEAATSWIERFRAAFGFSVVWPAAAAAILLAAMTTVLFISSGIERSGEIAADRSPAKNHEAAIAEAIPQQTPPEDSANDLESSPTGPPPDLKTTNESSRQTKVAAVRQPLIKQKTQTVRNIDLPVRNVPASKFRQPAETVAINDQKSIKSVAVLGDDDDNKDDSLRLSELFDDDEEN